MFCSQIVSIVIVVFAILISFLRRGVDIDYWKVDYDKFELYNSGNKSQIRAKKLSGALKFKTISSEGTTSGGCGCHSKSTENVDKTSGYPIESLKAILDLHKYLIESFPSVHNSEFIERIVINEYSLLYIWKGEETLSPIMLCAHMDVVPVSKDTLHLWKQDPFSGNIKDGYIYGRGALDFKNGVIGILEAVEELLNTGFKPKRTIYLAFGHDEEVMGMNGAKHIGQFVQTHLAKSSHFTLDFVLDEGTPIIRNFLPHPFPINQHLALIGVSEKGFLNLDLKISSNFNSSDSPRGHGSMPPTKGTIVVRLGEALSLLTKHQLPLQLDPKLNPSIRMLYNAAKFYPITSFQYWFFQLFGTELGRAIAEPILELLFYFSPKLADKLNPTLRTTLAVTKFHSDSGAENVIPTSASATVHLRTLNPVEFNTDNIHQERDLIVSQIRKILSDGGFSDIEVVVRGFSTPSSPQSSSSSIKSNNETSGYGLISNLAHFMSQQFIQSIPYRNLSEEIIPIIPLPSLMIAATDTKHYSHLIDKSKGGGIYRFSPIIMSPIDIASIHGINERIGVDAFSTYVDYFIMLIMAANK